jgi:hypothetical protein
MNLQVILASIAVLACLFALQKLIGSRWAAFTACLPLTSGPLIVAATMEFGVDQAQQILVGCVIATGAASLTLYAFGRLRHKPVTLAMVMALSVFSLIVIAQQQFNNLAEISAALAFGLILLTTVMTGSAPRSPSTSSLQLSRGSVIIPCLFLMVCLACFSFLPPKWSGILASSPLIALSFLFGLRRSENSAQTVLCAIAGANQGLMTKLILFCTAYLLLEIQIRWEVAYILTLVFTIAYFLTSTAVTRFFNQLYSPPTQKHPLATDRIASIHRHQQLQMPTKVAITLNSSV